MRRDRCQKPPISNRDEYGPIPVINVERDPDVCARGMQNKGVSCSHFPTETPRRRVREHPIIQARVEWEANSQWELQSL